MRNYFIKIKKFIIFEFFESILYVINKFIAEPEI